MKTSQFYLFIIPVYLLCSYHIVSAMEIMDNSIDISFETLSLSNDEYMGLFGANYLVESKNNLDYGLGVYGATSGRRGGFFTGGGQVKSQFNVFNNFFAGGEIFVGGGGGGSAPQGGGLMLRGAVFTGLKLHNQNFKVGYSYIQFPNGNIESHQLTLGYTYQFRTLLYSGWDYSEIDVTMPINEGSYLSINEKNLSIQTSFYYPFQSNKSVSGKQLNQRMEIVGIRYQSSILSNTWFDFDTGGAFGGGVDGFAQIFSGISYKYPILKKHYIASGILLGAAGGGNVNTGGGFVEKMYIGFDYNLFDNWFLFTHLGALTAPGGRFSALTFNLNLAKTYHKLDISSDKSNFHYKKEKISLTKFRIRPGIQSYILYSRHSRKSGNNTNANVSSAQLKLDSFFTNHIFITGHAVGALDGEAGGYAVGLVGVGYEISNNINVELLAGAAGGGGIDVGSGKVLESLVNLEIPLTPAWSIEPGFGYVLALNGKLSSWIASLGTIYHFSLPLVE